VATFIVLWYKRHCSRIILTVKNDRMVTCSSSKRNKSVFIGQKHKQPRTYGLDTFSELNFQKTENILLSANNHGKKTALGKTGKNILLIRNKMEI